MTEKATSPPLMSSASPATRRTAPSTMAARMMTAITISMAWANFRIADLNFVRIVPPVPAGHCFPWSRAAVRVFSISMARVMGPTPPGTGVM